MKIELLNHQFEVLTAKENDIFLLGGVGSGKTFTGSHFIVNEAIYSPGCTHFVGANSYSQLSNATLVSLFEELERLGIPYDYKKMHGWIDFEDSRIIARTVENFNYLRGMEIGSFWLDEGRDMKREVFNVLKGRQRNKKAKRYRSLVTTTPNGFDWIHDLTVGENKIAGARLIRAKTKSNKFLPSSYEDMLRGQYDSKFAMQELDGEFISLTSGSVYYMFSRDRHVKDFEREFNEKTGLPIYPTWVGMDFNVNPLTAIIGYFKNDTLYVYDEIWLENSNTFEMARTLKQRFQTEIVSVVPDSTGVSRKTSSNYSDHQILANEGLKVVYSTNPLVQDRFNCVNSLLEKNRVIINPRCKMLIRDLERLQRDNKDAMLSHISDGLGYLLFKHFPIQPIIKAKVRHY